MDNLQPNEPSSLWHYLQALDGQDRYFHFWLAETAVLPPIPVDIRDRVLAAPGGETAEEDADDGPLASLPNLGITAEILAVAQATEVTLLLLPAYWNYLGRCPQEWRHPDSERRLAKLTGSLVGLRVTPRDAAKIATGRAKTIVEILRKRANTTTGRVN